VNVSHETAMLKKSGSKCDKAVIQHLNEKMKRCVLHVLPGNAEAIVAKVRKQTGFSQTNFEVTFLSKNIKIGQYLLNLKLLEIFSWDRVF